MKAILFSDDSRFIQTVWGSSQQARLRQIAELHPEIIPPSRLAEYASVTAETEVIFTTWGMPRLTPEQLDLFPKLKAVFYAAGTVKGFADPLLDRDIQVFSAWAANAVPVAEFALSQILFSLKQGWKHAMALKRNPSPEAWVRQPLTGAYQATVGIVSLGMIGRKLCEYLRPFELKKIAYDPFATDETARRLGVERVTLPELFAASDVVTLHTPWLKETEGMITGKLLASMKPGTTFINTSRGAVVREAEMIEVLRRRPDLTAILDVTHPAEPPTADSPLYTLPNVVMTPHIAGALGNEVRRLADWMIEEFAAWQAGQPVRYEVTRELISKIA